jgi:hypothetical protein
MAMVSRFSVVDLSVNKRTRVVLIDKKGIIRYSHIGEGGYAKTEAVIRHLLAERGV